MSPGHFPDDPDEVREEAVAAKIASMAVLGQSYTQIGRALKLSDKKVRRIMATDDCMSFMRALRDESITRAKAELCVGTAKLARKIMKVIEEGLDSGNLKAVAPALKILGFGEEETKTDAGGNLIVVMPGAEDPNKPIDVTPKKGN